MAGVEYQVTKVDPTDPHTKGAVYQVHEVSEEVAATLGGKVYRARIIKDPTAPTVVGKVYQIVLIEDPSDPTVKGKVYNAILTGDSAAVVVGPAVSPLVLQGAIANSLQYVKAFGGTEQNGTPTPDTPMDIVCNNGVLKVNSQGQIYTDGTVETIKDSLNNTATVEMLLKVGDYQDVQEILSGAVTRKIGVKVLDGTEDWVKGQSFYCNTLTRALQADHSCYCTHYQGIMNNSAVVTDSNTCRVGYHIGSDIIWDRLYIYADRSLYATAQDFANYLAQQYAAGTPVIVIYPLATPTTESVAGQTLQVKTGDNVLEITQASLTGLELEAEYQKG